MIKSFKCSSTEKIFKGKYASKFPFEIQARALVKLRMIHVAKTKDDLRNPPGNRLEKLRGDRQGQLSIRINNQWRICFMWRNQNAYELEIVDYQ